MRTSVKNKLIEILKAGKVVIVGVGNSIRGDDGVGPYVISNIIYHLSSIIYHLYFIDAGQMPENYIGKIAAIKPKTVVIIDALDFSGRAGQMSIFKADKIKNAAVSTHSMSLGLFSQQIKEICNAEVLFVGIKPDSIELKEGLTDIVKASADELVGVIRRYLAT